MAPPAPEFLDNTEELLDTLEKEGIIQVPALDGSGTYTLIRGYRNIKNMPVAVFWDGRCGGTCHDGAFGHPEYGSQLAFSVYTRTWGNIGRWGAEMRARDVAAIVLQFIQSGYQIHLHRCGDLMSVDLDANYLRQ